MYRRISNRIKWNKNEENKNLYDIYMYNKKYTNLNKNTINNIKKNNIILNAHGNIKDGKQGLYNKESKTILKKKRANNDTKHLSTINKKIAISNISVGTKNEPEYNKKLFLNKEYNAKKISKNAINDNIKIKFNDVILNHNCFHEDNPILICSDENKIKKKYSAKNKVNSIINYYDSSLKKICNINESNKNIYENKNTINNALINNYDDKKSVQNDALNKIRKINEELKNKNFNMEKVNKNRLSVRNNNNKNSLENINEYPITSKNIYDSIYIPQINIKNIINSDNNNNNNDGNTKKGENNNNNLINTLNAYSNVKVAVRIKPIDDSEENIVSIFNKNYVLIEKENEKECYLLSQKKKQATYVFDVVFDVNSTQEEVFFHTAKPLIPHVFKGINCTVFAYGATGSGKTYTMLDDKNQNGIVQLSLLELFTIIKEEKCRNIKIVMSFLEVYNETIRDLLGKEKNKTLEVQEDVAEVKVSNLCEIEVKSYEQAMLLIIEGVKNRKMSPTRANKVSSRSHAILQIYVFNEILDSSMNIINYKAKLCFVDLAGSERASATSNKGDRFKEGSYINQSLLALANCINSLASNRNMSKVRVKYRDSKLTHLLKNSLEGNCLVVMIANINPSRKSFQESNNTLKYAFRARNIKLCATVQTNDNKESDIEKILKKNDMLQKEYDSLLNKYKLLRDFYSELKILFQLYKNALSCYQRKENCSDNLYILELKQEISIYEQLIKIKLGESKKKITNLNDNEEKKFINIFDSFINKNLDYFIHNNFNILNELDDEKKTLLDDKFLKNKDIKIKENAFEGKNNYTNSKLRIISNDDQINNELNHIIKNTDIFLNDNLKGIKSNMLNNHYISNEADIINNSNTIDSESYCDDNLKNVNNINENKEIKSEVYMNKNLKICENKEDYINSIKNSSINIINEKKEQFQCIHNNLTNMQNSILYSTINKQIENTPYFSKVKNNSNELLMKSNLNTENFILNENINNKTMINEFTNIENISNKIIDDENISNKIIDNQDITNKIVNNENINENIYNGNIINEIISNDNTNSHNTLSENINKGNICKMYELSEDNFKESKELHDICVIDKNKMENNNVDLCNKMNDTITNNNVVNFIKKKDSKQYNNNNNNKLKECKRKINIFDENIKHEHNENSTLIVKKKRIKNKI